MFKQNGMRFEKRSEAPHSERFFRIEDCTSEISIASSLNIHYGEAMTYEKRLMCEKLAAAEIGGYYIFNDGSELPV